MKHFIILLLTISLIYLWIENGYADKLYTWIDEKGVTHISKESPPKNATLKDIMDYASRPEEQKPVVPEEKNQAVKVQEKKPKKTGSDKISTESVEGIEPEVYYDDDSDPDHYKRKKRRKERLEKGKSRQEENNPDGPTEKVKHKQRSHKSR